MSEVYAYTWSERGRLQHIVRGEVWDTPPHSLRYHRTVAICGYRPKWGWVEADTVERPDLHGCRRCYTRRGEGK